MESSRITSANGEPADEALPYEARLTQTENTFTVRNTVSCEDEDDARLTLVKRVVNKHGGTAKPGDWTLTADGPEGFAGRAEARTSPMWRFRLERTLSASRAAPRGTGPSAGPARTPGAMTYRSPRTR